VLALLALPARGPYVVLRPDGTEIHLMEPPTRKGPLLVGRLWPQGTLVSFPAREVDAARTEAANAAGAPGPTPTPGALVLADVARRARPTPVPLTDLGKLNRSRGEAEKELSKASGTAKQPDAEVEAERPRRLHRAPETQDHLDVNGHGEEWWRARARDVREELNEAREEAAASEADAVAWERGWIPGGTARSSWAWELQQRRDAAQRARARAAAAERKMRELEDEARKADAYPGWLR
jgi:hypothetical protein